MTFISTSAVIYLQLGVWLKQFRIVNGGKGQERDYNYGSNSILAYNFCTISAGRSFI